MTCILVVDDVEDIRLILQADLEDDGYEVVMASGGEEALAILQNKAIDLMLLDLQMPEVSGLDVLTALQSEGRLETLPVIMVSAVDKDDRIVQALDLGARDYVTKPYVPPVLLARIRTVLKQHEQQLQLADSNEKLEQLAAIDGLTGLPNRRHFFEMASREIQRARRHHRPLSFAMLDIDHFKLINDEYGHGAGDQVLRQVAGIFRQVLRENDLVGRVGGEEFALCLPETTPEEALIPLERIRQQVRNSPVVLGSGQDMATIQVTLSGGVSDFTLNDESADPVLARADELLYQAKNAGRDRVLYQPLPTGGL